MVGARRHRSRPPPATSTATAAIDLVAVGGTERARLAQRRRRPLPRAVGRARRRRPPTPPSSRSPISTATATSTSFLGQGSKTAAVARVYLNDKAGCGHFTLHAGARCRRKPARASALAVGDIDDDGDLDLVLGQIGGPVRVYVNRGNAFLDDRSFTLLPDQTSADVPGLLLADLDGDCLPELVVPRAGAAPLLWRSAGGGKLADGGSFDQAVLATGALRRRRRRRRRCRRAPVGRHDRPAARGAAVRALALALGARRWRAGVRRHPQDAVRTTHDRGRARYQNQEYRAADRGLRRHRARSGRHARSSARAPTSTSACRGSSSARSPRRAPRSRSCSPSIPHYTLSDPSHSPKLREFFEEVRSSFVPGYGKSEGEAELEHVGADERHRRAAARDAGRRHPRRAAGARGDAVRAPPGPARVRRPRRCAATPAAGGCRTRRRATSPTTRSSTTSRRATTKGAWSARVASPERPITLPVHGVPRRRRADALVQALVRLGGGRRRRRRRGGGRRVAGTAEQAPRARCRRARFRSACGSEVRLRR